MLYILHRVGIHFLIESKSSAPIVPENHRLPAFIEKSQTYCPFGKDIQFLPIYFYNDVIRIEEFGMTSRYRILDYNKTPAKATCKTIKTAINAGFSCGPELSASYPSTSRWLW